MCSSITHEFLGAGMVEPGRIQKFKAQHMAIRICRIVTRSGGVATGMWKNNTLIQKLRTKATENEDRDYQYLRTAMLNLRIMITKIEFQAYRKCGSKVETFVAAMCGNEAGQFICTERSTPLKQDTNNDLKRRSANEQLKKEKGP